MDPARTWHVAWGGQTYGPYTSDELKEYRQTGRIEEGALVWRDGFADWAAIATVPELAAISVSQTAVLAGRAAPGSAKASGQTMSCPACGAENRVRATVCSACMVEFASWSAIQDANTLAPIEKPTLATKTKPLGAANKVEQVLGPERPGGITFLCVLIALSVLLQGVLLVTDAGVEAVGSEGGSSIGLMMTGLFVTFAFYSAALAGLWRMKKWGVLAYVGASVADFGFALALGMGGGSGLILRGAIIVWLFKKWEDME